MDVQFLFCFVYDYASGLGNLTTWSLVTLASLMKPGCLCLNWLHHNQSILIFAHIRLEWTPWCGDVSGSTSSCSPMAKPTHSPPQPSSPLTTLKRHVELTGTFASVSFTFKTFVYHWQCPACWFTKLSGHPKKSLSPNQYEQLFLANKMHQN